MLVEPYFSHEIEEHLLNDCFIISGTRFVLNVLKSFLKMIKKGSEGCKKAPIFKNQGLKLDMSTEKKKYSETAHE